MSSLRVISDCIISSHSDPLRNWSVLLDLLPQHAFKLEGLDSSLINCYEGKNTRNVDGFEPELATNNITESDERPTNIVRADIL